MDSRSLPLLRADEEGDGGLAPNPLRRVLVGFRDRRALLRARREAEALGLEPADLSVFPPPRDAAAGFDLVRRLRDHLPDIASEHRGVFDGCLALLEREFLLVLLEAASVTERARLEETFAEHGGVIVGEDGGMFPEPDAAERIGETDVRLRAANGEDG